MYDPDAERLLAEIKAGLSVFRLAIEQRKLLIEQSEKLVASANETRERVLSDATGPKQASAVTRRKPLPDAPA